MALNAKGSGFDRFLFAYQERKWEGMEPLNFYTLDNDYVDFLKKAETEKRGFSRIPNMGYGDLRKPKFLCGIVLCVHNVNYFVPVSSYKKQQADNFLIYADNDLVTSSLRFNYMFPVPLELLRVRVIANESDRAYRALLAQELRYCLKNQSKIRYLAERTYKRVMLGKNPGLVLNSCNFSLLEKKCIEYCEMHDHSVPEKHALPKAGKIQPEKTPFNDLLVQQTSKENNRQEKKGQDIER